MYRLPDILFTTIEPPVDLPMLARAVSSGAHLLTQKGKSQRGKRQGDQQRKAYLLTDLLDIL